MGYNQTSWKNGTTEVSAEALNNMEKRIASLDNLSNANLLINGDFQMWQRGESFTTISSTIYSADRWKLGGHLTLNKDVKDIKIGRSTANASGEQLISQYVEIGRSLLGKTLTLSLDVVGSNNITGLSTRICDKDTSMISIKEYTVSTKATRITHTFTVPNSMKSFLQIDILHSKEAVIPTGQYVYINNVKLEMGSITTPFVPRLHVEELMLCKRYFERLGNGNDEYLGPITMVGANTFEGGVSCEITKRTKSPTITFGNVSHFRIRHWGGAASVNTMVGASRDGRHIILVGTANVDGSIRNGHLQRQDSATAAYIDVDAEIY